jgi:hypothetical protein
MQGASRPVDARTRPITNWYDAELCVISCCTGPRCHRFRTAVSMLATALVYMQEIRPCLKLWNQLVYILTAGC